MKARSALNMNPAIRFPLLHAVLFIMLMLCGSLLVAQPEPDYKFFQGRVKTCKEECFKAKDRAGVIETLEHQRERVKENDFEIHYDSIGKKLRKIELSKDGQGVKRNFYYTYDGFNQLAQVRIVSKLGVLIKATTYWNTYDSLGRLLACYVDFNDEPRSVAYVYTYSSSGNCIEYFLPASDSQGTRLPSREFDSKRNLVKYWSYTHFGNLIGTGVLTYDSLGNKIQEELFDKSGFNYLNYGWKYANGHDPVRHEVCRANSTSCESWTYKYEYDTHGNWIRRIEYRNGKAAYVKERTITYYE